MTRSARISRVTARARTGIAVAVRFGLSNYVFPLAVAWAAAAIAVKQSGNTAIVITSAICVIACLLLAASYVFYAWWDWRYILLLGGSILVNQVVALGGIDNWRAYMPLGLAG